MMESLQMVKETTFQAEQRETNLMDNAAVLGDLNFLVNKCLFNFASGIEHTASSDSNGTDDLVSCPEVKLLLALSNCQYTMLYILPRWRNSFFFLVLESIELIEMDWNEQTAGSLEETWIP